MKLERGRQGSLRLNLPGKAEYYSFNPSPLDSVVMWLANPRHA